MVVERDPDQVERLIARHAQRQAVRRVFDKHDIAGTHQQNEQLTKRGRVAGSDDDLIQAERLALHAGDALGQSLPQHAGPFVGPIVEGGGPSGAQRRAGRRPIFSTGIKAGSGSPQRSSIMPGRISACGSTGNGIA